MNPSTPRSWTSSLSDSTFGQSTEYGRSSTSSSEESEFRQHRLSPMFGIPIASDPPHYATPAHHPSTRAQREHIDLHDGKTQHCNRNLTFDDFVPSHQLVQDKPAKRMGASWDVLRALKKPLKKMTRKTSVRLRGHGDQYTSLS